MPDKCLDCPAPSADMDGFIVSGPGGAPRSEGSGVSSPEGPFVREAPQTGHVVIMGTLGADGNPGTLPDAPQVGWAYVAEDAGEYGGVQATEGDMVYCMSLNPTRWGVLQADSDDSGSDLVSVDASFECDPMENYAPYGPVAEIVVYNYEFDMNVLGRSNPIPAPGGLLEVPPLRDISWNFLDDPDFSAVAFVSVRFTSAERSGDAFSVYDAEFSLPFWGWLSPGDVMSCETSCPVNCLGPERCELEVVSAPASGSRTFQIRASAGPVLSLTSVKASGASSVQTVDMSCLNYRYGALASLSASFGCSSAYAAAGGSSITVGTDMMYYADDAFPSDFCDPSSIMTASLAGGSFEIRGTDYDRMAAACSTSATFAFILDSGAFGRISADDFAQFFNGSIAQGGHLDSMNGRLRFVLNSRVELTSQDPGGPDIVVSLSVYEAYPALTLTSAKADGTSSSQTVDMSCLVPPVFDGLADGLVPANSPATQTADLLSDDGTWMRPVTDAEIDALFAE